MRIESFDTLRRDLFNLEFCWTTTDAERILVGAVDCWVIRIIGSLHFRPIDTKAIQMPCTNILWKSCKLNGDTHTSTTLTRTPQRSYYGKTVNTIHSQAREFTISCARRPSSPVAVVVMRNSINKWNIIECRRWEIGLAFLRIVDYRIPP